MISNLIEREQDAAGIAPGYLMDVFRGALTAYYVEERMKALAKTGQVRLRRFLPRARS